ncbi:unnamed protein product [Mytilus coruscus]|uniref:Uncharacterized protein n=1 Tax=Mytilus coruscus TaxID=42192 RepID=A0A6J8A943_MYTCO|nr:unnamed protein product [Mytilus coruscus]
MCEAERFGKVTNFELHHFSDASTTGYGQCSYLLLVSEDGQVNCSLFMSKARVVPRKSLTIPRLELSAAVVSVRHLISRLLRVELNFDNIVEWFWTDSNIVLGYIAKESSRFDIFVSNRVQQILDHTSPKQWKYIELINPADIASRGLPAEELSRNTIWFNRLHFLWGNESALPDQSIPKLDLEDPEVRRAKTLITQTDKCYSSILDRIEYFW